MNQVKQIHFSVLDGKNALEFALFFFAFFTVQCAIWSFEFCRHKLYTDIPAFTQERYPDNPCVTTAAMQILESREEKQLDVER